MCHALFQVSVVHATFQTGRSPVARKSLKRPGAVEMADEH